MPELVVPTVERVGLRIIRKSNTWERAQ